ncbi:T9SS type A sorting domain-containing protein [Seonamhaeicola sp. MEBiC1930]|uniref:T9SS type A sorting domain-containing protein n=1 Tax=Seonamhaeicola sp. MEBiC01930 TaxID=2976768 RepID=UPI00324FAB86
MKKITLIFTLLFCLIGVETIYAQSLQREISLKEQIENSNLVVEGKVIAKESFWDASGGLIYTANTIEVYKVFKGDPIETVDVITLGGTVGLDALIVHPSLLLSQEDVGVFTLQNSKTLNRLSGKESANKEYKPYALSQGFFRYNLTNDLAANSFKKMKGIKSSFYNEITAFTRQGYMQIKDFGSDYKTKTSKGLLPPSSLTLNKSVVSAGTGEELIITGSGFGAGQGNVWFSNADDGGATLIAALDSQVTSWSDTSITVEVPSRAGTGSVVVEDTSNAQSPGAALTVSYSEINVSFDPGSGLQDFQIQHYNDNASGGYTWEMQTDFFNNAAAKAAFERAFDKWVCETGINWTISGSATAVDVIGSSSDGTNVIRFDNGSELGATTLGKCYSWYTSCDGLNWWVSELDIVFDDTTDWHYGTDLPGFSEYDFESVALHELGHGHQLAHVIDPTVDGDNLDDVMHYAISNGESQKVISSDNSTAANNIQSRSEGSVICAQPLMTSGSCSLSIDENDLEKAISVYPNPSRGEFQIRNASQLNLDRAVIYDVSGRQISSHDLANTSRIKTINMEGAASGLYFVNIYSERAMVTMKIMVD